MDLAAEPQHSVALPQGTIRYRTVGSGPTLLFVHGLLVDGLVWAEVVDRLADTHRCVVPDLPLGAHQVALAPGADLSPPGLADLLADFMAALGLTEVVLVGNDTGGALCQLLLVRHPDRLAGVVLTNADAFENFPPPVLRPLYRLGGTRPGAWLTGRVLRLRLVQRAVMAMVTHRAFQPAAADRWLGRSAADPAIRRDVAAVVGNARPRHTLDAAAAFATFDRPVLVVWGQDDLLFRPRFGERLAAAFPRGRLVTVPGARTFVQLDAPGVVAEAVADFTRDRRAAA
jgi:pimeloyl-ACP methyl ester carboxylesterase